MSHHYRCSRCRGRNLFSRAVQEYVKPKRCKHCGYGRFYIDRERTTRRACRCSGLHYPHRPGSRYCELHPQHNAHRAQRQGCPPDVVMDLLAEAAWSGSGKKVKGGDPPF